MTPTNIDISPIATLNRRFILDYPIDAARSIEALPLETSLASLEGQSPIALARLFEKLSPAFAEALLLNLDESQMLEILKSLEILTAAGILSRLETERRDYYLNRLNKSVAKELRSFLQYPEDTAGRLMKSVVYEFREDATVGQALAFLKSQKAVSVQQLYLTDNHRTLRSQVDVNQLLIADEHEVLHTLSRPIRALAQAFDTRTEVVELLDKRRVTHLPVIDIDHRLIGVIEAQGLFDALRENLTSNMQTMVGASAEERALSSSFFSVKKRQPWLQVNLLTAFLAAAVVALFEDTISRFTALAILLPIAAGQSGNAGAQALAVTMRGLTLKEISLSHWLRVMLKECGAGLMNGIGISITCASGIYVWSRSFGLALVMALSMIISMTIAGMAGALVPILLKRFGLDPAQSSSIVLTTVTDIAGFMSFLGIATLLSGMLVEG